jgi:hypothetical protein
MSGIVEGKKTSGWFQKLLEKTGMGMGASRYTSAALNIWEAGLIALALAHLFPFLHLPLPSAQHQIAPCGSDAMDAGGLLPLAVFLSTSPKPEICAAVPSKAIQDRCLSQIAVCWTLMR